MSAAPVGGTRARADVRGRCPHPESAVRQRIFDAEREREGIARLRIEDVFHHDPVRLALGGGPGGDRGLGIGHVHHAVVDDRLGLLAPIVVETRNFQTGTSRLTVCLSICLSGL